jgi:hypothetical protein
VRVAQAFASADERFGADGAVVPYDETTGEGVQALASAYARNALRKTERSVGVEDRF